MSIFEDVGRRHHLTAKSGFLLGGDAPGVADVVTATLWSTMTDRFPKIAAMFEEAAPHIAALTRRVAELPALAKLARQGAAGLRRRLLRRPDRGFAAKGAARLSVRDFRATAAINLISAQRQRLRRRGESARRRVASRHALPVRPPTALAEIAIAHGGEIYRVALKRVTTSRRYTLRVRAASRDVLLTMPARGTLKQAREFAERHAAWIGVRLARLPQPVAFAPGEIAPLRGVDHRIVHRPARAASSGWRRAPRGR